MTPRYLQADPTSRDRWMISYLDVLTILLIFFVAVAAKSLETPPPSRAAPAAPRVEPRQPLVKIQRKLEQRGLDLELQSRGLEFRAILHVNRQRERVPKERMARLGNRGFDAEQALNSRGFGIGHNLFDERFAARRGAMWARPEQRNHTARGVEQRISRSGDQSYAQRTTQHDQDSGRLEKVDQMDAGGGDSRYGRAQGDRNAEQHSSVE